MMSDTDGKMRYSHVGCYSLGVLCGIAERAHKHGWVMVSHRYAESPGIYEAIFSAHDPDRELEDIEFEERRSCPKQWRDWLPPASPLPTSGRVPAAPTEDRSGLDPD